MPASHRDVRCYAIRAPATIFLPSTATTNSTKHSKGFRGLDRQNRELKVDQCPATPNGLAATHQSQPELAWITVININCRALKYNVTGVHVASGFAHCI